MDPALIEDCVHCGFCLPTCPTYVLWGEETDSPRGRILLMRAANEEGPELSLAQVDAWDNCLGCMACVTACPSGVQYDRLIEQTREVVERRHVRPRLERLHRRMLFELFPHPGRMRALAPLIALGRRLPTDRLLRRTPRLNALARLAPSGATWRRLPDHTPALGDRRGSVGFIQGCVQRVFFGDVNEATVAVLAAEGWEVHSPRLPRCCGALQLHSGEADAARALARETIAAFEHFDVVVVNAAGCGAALKEYGALLGDARAHAFSAKVRDVTELLAEHEPRAPRGPVELKLAYHDACHLAHAQGVRSQPRDLLLGIPGIELVEPAEWELCCGSAGVYNLLQPEPAADLGRRKAENLLATGAEAVAAANPGCALQIAVYAPGLPVHHPIELLERSIARGASRDRARTARRTAGRGRLRSRLRYPMRP